MADLPVEILSKIITHLPHDGKLVQTMLVCRRFRDIIELVLYRSITLRSQPTGLLPQLQVLDLTPEVTDLDLTHLRLKTLVLLFPDSNFYDEGEDPMAIVARHFWMPTLRTLQIENFTFEGQWGHLFPLERYQTSPIIDLRLNIVFCSNQLHGVLPQILQSVKSLRRFTVKFSSISDMQMDDLDEKLSPVVITSALLPHALTLEQITIAIGSDVHISRALPTHGFTHFAALRKLAIPEPFLHYCKGSTTQLALPLQLEELQLQYIARPSWCKEAHLERLQVLARMKQTSLRALKLVVWWNEVSAWGFKDSTPYPMPLEMETFPHTFQQVGVLFSRVDQPYFKNTPLGHNKFRYC